MDYIYVNKATLDIEYTQFNDEDGQWIGGPFSDTSKYDRFDVTGLNLKFLKVERGEESYNPPQYTQVAVTDINGNPPLDSQWIPTYENGSEILKPYYRVVEDTSLMNDSTTIQTLKDNYKQKIQDECNKRIEALVASYGSEEKGFDRKVAEAERWGSDKDIDTNKYPILIAEDTNTNGESTIETMDILVADVLSKKSAWEYAYGTWVGKKRKARLDIDALTGNYVDIEANCVNIINGVNWSIL